MLLKKTDAGYPQRYGVEATGRPDTWYVLSDQIHLYPTPDAVYVLGCRHAVAPQSLTGDAATTQLPPDWENVLLDGAQSRLEKFLGEGGADDSFVLYRDGLARLRARGNTQPARRMKGFYRGYPG